MGKCPFLSHYNLYTDCLMMDCSLYDSVGHTCSICVIAQTLRSNAEVFP